MKESKYQNTSILSNMIWRFTERCGAQGVTFVVSIILARLLDPEVYGTVALVTVFTTILQVFVDSGLGNALIQKKDADDLDFSTVFFFNLFVCICLYLLMFIGAPAISGYYGDSSLTAIIRVLSLTIVISGVKNVQQAYVSRSMQFRRFFFATLGGTVGAAVIGVILAYAGFGVWALVVQQIFNLFVDTVILWITVKWRPHWMFSFVRLKRLYQFGWKLLASSLIDTVYNNVRQLIIGKYYSASDLSFYNRGKQFPSLIVLNINASIDSVIFSVMSSAQDDVSRIKMMTKRSITTSVYIMAPMMIGLAFVAEPLVRLILTEKWMPCVFYLRIFCITYMFHPIHTANLKAIVSIGRSDLNLQLEIKKKIVGIVLLLITMKISVEAMAYSLLVSSVLCQIINASPNKKLLNYGYGEQLRDILPSILLSVIMGFCVYPIQWLALPDILELFMQVLLGTAIYIVGSILLKIESFDYIFRLIKPFIWRGK